MTLILINLALNSPSTVESSVTKPSSTVINTTAQPSTEAKETTAEDTTKPTEKATQKATKKSADKKSESKSKSESSNSEVSENNYYYNYSDNTSSDKGSSSKANEKSESNTKKETIKPTTKPTQANDNIYLSYSSVSVNKGDVVFLSLINAESGVSWSVSNSSVIQNYGGNGNQCSFKTLKKGSATVTAHYNGKNYYCTVTVN